MKTRNHKRKWRNFLIRRDIQLRLAIYNLIFLLLAISVVIATALIPLYTNFQNPENLWSQHFSAKFFIVIIDRLAVAFACIFVAAFVFQIVITHRFAGPLINFGKTFQKITEGDLTRKISLRRKDFLHKEASQVNEMADALTMLISTIKEDINLLLLILEDASSGKIEANQLEAKLLEAAKQAARCKENLSRLKIPLESDTGMN